MPAVIVAGVSCVFAHARHGVPGGHATAGTLLTLHAHHAVALDSTRAGQCTALLRLVDICVQNFRQFGGRTGEALGIEKVRLARVGRASVTLTPLLCKLQSIVQRLAGRRPRLQHSKK